MSQTNVEHSDSISSQEPREDDGKKTKSRRPANTAFRQQRLKAWQPILTPKTVLPLFFVVGIIFAPIGGLLIWASAQVEEISIDYSNCAKKAQNSTNLRYPPEASDFIDVPSDKVSSYFKSRQVTGGRPKWAHSTVMVNYSSSVSVNTSVCSLQFDIENDIGPPVLLYYRLTDFYQNHRRYVKSEDASQLKGTFRSNASISNSDCDPLKTDETGKAYYPCGLIANSMFNDTFKTPLELITVGTGDERFYNMTNKGIAWDSDKDLYKKAPYTNEQVAPPPNWRKRYPNGYTDDNPIPNLNEDEAFQVWMRTAGLPAFSKLALRNDTGTMSVGRYQLDIYDNFDVTEYGGTKSMLISTRTVMGGKNPFLGIAYVVVGGLCILLGTLFTATHLIKPRQVPAAADKATAIVRLTWSRKLGDHTYLTWNNDNPSTAHATGRVLRPGEA